jgi:hypothetical protein
MTSLVTAARWLLGLFVDDGSLALAILVIVLLSWTFSTLMSDMPLAAGAVLRAFRQCHESGTGLVTRMTVRGETSALGH